MHRRVSRSVPPSQVGTLPRSAAASRPRHASACCNAESNAIVLVSRVATLDERPVP